MKYKILYDPEYKILMENVNLAIEDGWEPIGGIAVDGGEDYTDYYQAMVKSPELTPEEILEALGCS